MAKKKRTYIFPLLANMWLSEYTYKYICERKVFENTYVFKPEYYLCMYLVRRYKHLGILR